MNARANIGPRGCAWRRRLGFIAFAAGVLPFWVGALGMSQARHRT